MLKHRNRIPLDYSLCTMTVTVYGKEGRRVLEGVHYEFTTTRGVAGGMATHDRQGLLVIPGSDTIAVGDRVVMGIGPEVIARDALNTAAFPTLMVVGSVKPRFFRGKPCHVEARGL